MTGPSITGQTATVLIMAKEPVPGRVKTRLCPPLSTVEAAELAAAAIADTLEAARSATRFQRVVVALEGAPGPWLGPEVEVIEQRGAGFNERLAGAWAAMDGPVVQIGMDAPQVSPAMLDGAARLLYDNDAVFGPALDGGWWALGMRIPDPTVFAGIVMSAATTGSQQRGALTARDWRVADLPTLRDVDQYEDALAVARIAPASRFARRFADLGARRTALVNAHDGRSAP